MDKDNNESVEFILNQDRLNYTYNNLECKQN